MNPFDLGPHAGFIIASYVTTFGIVAGLILWVLIDRAKQKSDLADLEAQGIKRSAATSQDPASEETSG
ncbi:heme exporter protein CcmD [Roseibium hamelinense]|nr:heme exporter protein CcmD [Roseibium hamelinense]MTI43403.1 heme exporter protein CcmD [Roseibium hamelinense]